MVPRMVGVFWGQSVNTFVFQPKLIRRCPMSLEHLLSSRRVVKVCHDFAGLNVQRRKDLCDRDADIYIDS